MKYILILLATLSITAVTAQIKVTATEAYQVLNKKPKKVQLLDVRTDKEYAAKHIKNSIHADWNNAEIFEEKVKTLNKKKPVYLYCLSGGRSAKAAKMLTENGFEVREIEGGILKWENSNLPIESKDTMLSGLTKRKFEEIVKQHEVVLVDFYATWCGPCKEMEPNIAHIQNKYKGKVEVLKIDVDKNSNLTKALKIGSIPKLYIYKKGKLTWQKDGYTDLETIEKNI